MKHSKDKALLETPELHISPVNIVDYLQHVPDVVLRVYGEHHSHYVVVPKHEELTVVVLEVVLHDYVIPVGDVVLEDDFICGVDAHDCFCFCLLALLCFACSSQIFLVYNIHVESGGYRGYIS